MTLLENVFLCRNNGRGRRMMLSLLVGIFFFASAIFSQAQADSDLLKTLQGHRSNTISAVASSPDGQKIASADDEGGIQIWDFASGKPLLALGEDQRSVQSLAFSPDGAFLAAAVSIGIRSHAVRIWDISSGKLLHDMREHSQTINDIAYSPNGKRIASVGNDNSLRIWNTTYGTLESTEKQTKNNLMAVAYSPDGKKIITTENWEGGIKVWDAVNVRLMHSFAGHADWVLSVAYSPNGKEFATGSRDGSVYVWDADTGKKIRVLRDPELDAVNAVVYSPDGTYVAGATRSQRIMVWQDAAGKLVNFYEGHQLSVTALSFASGGRYLVSAGLDGTVRIWNGPGQGGPESIFAQAQKYEFGTEPMDQDYAVAVRLYQQAAEKGNAEAQYRLGILYDQGEGVSKNQEEAKRWWALAAGQGNLAAKTALEGERKVAKVVPPPPALTEEKAPPAVEVKTIVPDEKKQKAAPESAPQKPLEVAKVAPPPSPPPPVKDKESLYNQALKLYKGEGVKKDLGQAFKIFHESAEMGNSKAQYRLGFMYSLGKGVKKDDQQAVNWWQKAAKQNDPDAQYYLGYMYEIGAGVKQDMATAKQWYEKAAANGSVNAVQSLKMMP